MSESGKVAELSDKLLSILQARTEALLALRDEACNIRAAISDPRQQRELDWIFDSAGEEIRRTQSVHERLGKIIRAPRPRISRVK